MLKQQHVGDDSSQPWSDQCWMGSNELLCGSPGEETPLFVPTAVTSGLSFLKMASCKIISYYTVVEMLD